MTTDNRKLIQLRRCREMTPKMKANLLGDALTKFAWFICEKCIILTPFNDAF